MVIKKIKDSLINNQKRNKSSNTNEKEKYPYLLDWALFITITTLSYYVIRPFVSPMLVALLTAYLMKPLVDILYKFVKSYRLALVISILIILVPTFSFIYYASQGAKPIINEISSLSLDLSNLLELIKEKSLENRILNMLGFPEYINNFQGIIQKISISLRDYLLSIFVNIPTIILEVLIYLISTYYFIIESPKLANYYKIMTERLSKKRQFTLNAVLKGLKNAFDVLVVSYVTMTVIITILAYIIYLLFHIPYAFIWAIMTGLFGLLPVLGAWMVYGGVAFYLYSAGRNIEAIIVLVYGIIVINLIPDLIIRPTLSANKANVHPFTVILGFFGGPLIFGVIGFILGPIILVVFETVVREYYKYYILDEKEKVYNSNSNIESHK